MIIEKSSEESKLTLSLAGRLDTSTAPMLEEELANSLSGINELHFDFEGLEYLSSAGLRILLTTQKIMSKQGKMVLHNVNDTINEVFEVTGFSDFLTIE